MASGNGALTALTLLDYSDRELLLLVMDLSDADKDGFTSSHQIADALGVEGEHRLNSVGSRMAVLRRIGAVERDFNAPKSHTARWTVTPMGRLLASGSLTASLQKSLDGLKPEQMLLAARVVARTYRTAPETAGMMLRREMRYASGLKRV